MQASRKALTPPAHPMIHEALVNTMPLIIKDIRTLECASTGLPKQTRNCCQSQHTRAVHVPCMNAHDALNPTASLSLDQALITPLGWSSRQQLQLPAMGHTCSQGTESESSLDIFLPIQTTIAMSDGFSIQRIHRLANFQRIRLVPIPICM